MTNRRAKYINMVKHISDVPQSIIDKEIRITQRSPFRQSYHIEVESGGIADPVGFSYFNHEYHLFHQWHPLVFSQNPHVTQQGWKHLISKNLVDWKSLGAGLEADTPFDLYGVYSGSALPIKNKLFIMYTGNCWVNTQSKNDWHRIPYQLGALMDKDNNFEKFKKPLIKGPLQNYTEHFRDPKLFEKNNELYAVLGIQKSVKIGTALLVKSKNIHHWQVVGEIKTHHSDLGYMWECPDYYELNGRGILAFCPQGMSVKANRFRNIYQAGYLVGSPLNLEDATFQCGQFQELDLGFDFYAMQTMLDPFGRRILIAWMGISDLHYPTETYHYSGCLTFPRQLKLKNNHLYQWPIEEINQLHQAKINIKELVSNLSRISMGEVNARDIQFCLDCSKADTFVMDLFCDKNDKQHLRLIFNHRKNEFIVDRSHCGINFSEEYGDSRFCSINLNKTVRVRILQDISSAEIFLESGKEVFSMRVFPDPDQTQVFVDSKGGSSAINGTAYQLRSMIN